MILFKLTTLFNIETFEIASKPKMFCKTQKYQIFATNETLLVLEKRGYVFGKFLKGGFAYFLCNNSKNEYLY